ncbi:MAG: hypothetical protein JWL86_6481 [Rhizobium sp.]|nr:hypothetical protein [Rhizobium sp.]
MASEKTVELAKKLYTNTKLKMIDWQEDPFYSGYSTSFKNGKCRIYKDDDNDVYLAVHNSQDEIVEELGPVDIAGAFDFGSNELIELFQLAKRRALKADEVVDDLLKEIDDLDIPF